MLGFLNRIRPQDITLVQSDWISGPEDYTHVWIASYYGENIGRVTYNYLSETWQTIGEIYCKPSTILKEVHMLKDRYDYGAENVSHEEIKELRRSRKVLSNFLNKQHYKHGN